VGESGAGKTTLIRAIVGLVARGARLVAGNVNLLGHSVFALREHALSRIRGSQVGVIVQNARSHLNPVLPIGLQIANVYRAHRNCNTREAMDRAVKMLRAVGIPAPEDRMRAYPHELSGGMAQRALIGMALVCEPRVVLADEPSSGLDVTIQDQVLRLLRRLVTDSGASTLLVTRDMGIVANFCDRVGVMVKGRIIEIGNVPEIFQTAQHEYTKTLIAAASLRGEARSAGVASSA
jgi:ABC-type dipeptide/oligopeptide/nickel transport system ATPase component